MPGLWRAQGIRGDGDGERLANLQISQIQVRIGLNQAFYCRTKTGSQLGQSIAGAYGVGVQAACLQAAFAQQLTAREIAEAAGQGDDIAREAFDRELKRRVALKVLRTDRTSEATLNRFRREVAIARDAASPRLVRVFDIGQSGDTVFLTMELVEGESLRELLSRGPLAPAGARGRRMRWICSMRPYTIWSSRMAFPAF